MRKLLLLPLFALLLALHLAAPPTSAAELKLDIKLFLGFSETTYVAMLETGRERQDICQQQSDRR
ncbi:MAG: hypothetical protein KJO40_08780 [Deltaproteobacteria bacterium]|nr:hypothetical protein [Deltaproteobacteria bacterium]NND30151.1 hypothetical protein [Myxococcales bacterium]MBT8464739.1 hypothetical protein [Deltaproteobacteria bacterium]MBT8481307.1 hypothetical protein [Deltaproteobacteria bacterium]NNK08999.1 hypothetical protein [Myxococcales bacterium]